jgi:hypothetical protein
MKGVYMQCKICNIERIDLRQHIKIHGMTVKQYKEQFKVDAVVEKDLASTRRNARRDKYKIVCSIPTCGLKFKTERQLLRHCRKMQDTEHSKLIYTDQNKRDWVECKICGLRRKKLLIHIKDHDITKEEYEDKYGKCLFSETYLANLIANGSSNHESDKYKGKLNPFYNHEHSKQTKDTMSASIKASNAKLSQHFNKDRKHTENTKHNMSVGRMGENNHRFGKPAAHGCSRGIQGFRADIGHYVRSTLEANYARYLISKSIKYEYETRAFLLITEEGKKTNYWPDFYLVETDEYVELKNYKRKGIDKVELLQKQYPEVKIKVIYQDSDGWLKIEAECSEIIELWETSKKNLQKTPELYVKFQSNLLQEVIA